MAIAFDAKTEYNPVSYTLGTTFLSHTCSGSNRILFVNVVDWGTTDDIGTVTFGGNAMTKIQHVSVTSISNHMYLFMLVNPPTGSQALVISGSGTKAYLFCGAFSYTGAAQTSQPDNSTSGNDTTGTTHALTLTTVADNCWSVFVQRACGSSLSSKTNITDRGDLSSYYYGFGDSNSAITPAGNYTQTVTTAGNIGFGKIQCSFSPASSAVASHLLSSTGVGS